MTKRQAPSKFTLVHSGAGPLSPPPNRGQLWYDHQIPEQFFRGLPGIAKKVRWVRQHLPRASRVKVGRCSAWYEADIVGWLEAQRGDQRRSA